MFDIEGARQDPIYKRRQEIVFLVLAGIFLGTLAMLNILGITRFVDFSFDVFGLRVPFMVAVGVLPYPVTFLCTDFISEFYGRKRANLVVWVGLLLNLWVVAVLWLGGALPPELSLDPKTGLPLTGEPGRIFFEVKHLAMGAVTASMIAYLAAQFCDVQLFHWIKKRTKGRHLWLRNNGSTCISQAVDSVAVICVTHFYAAALPVDDALPLAPQILTFIASSYVFKVTAAAIDTLPFYLGVRWLGPYLGIEKAP